jgi:methylmalonyl-CoA mutase
MLYEHRKHTGEMPIVGVNTFTDPDSSTPSAEEFDIEVTRSDESEKMMVISRNREFKETHSAESEEGLNRLKQVARKGGNLFEVMMHIVEHCSVGQVTQALFESGGKFRRNM